MLTVFPWILPVVFHCKKNGEGRPKLSAVLFWVNWVPSDQAMFISHVYAFERLLKGRLRVRPPPYKAFEGPLRAF